MENQNSKSEAEIQEKIQATLDSLEGLKRQKVSENLSRRLNEIPVFRTKIFKLSPQLAWKVAACLAILILLNVFTILNSNKNSNRTNNERSPFANEYFSYLNFSSI